MNKFGLQIHRDTGNYEDMLTRLRPRVILTLGGRPGGNLDLLRRAYDILGDSAIYIHRFWSHYGPGDLDNFSQYIKTNGTSPRWFMDTVYEIAQNDLIKSFADKVYFYTFNETGFDQWDSFIAWHTTAVELADVANLRLVCLNTAVGNPAGSLEEQAAIWRRAEPLFERLQDSRSAIGVHEYFPGAWDLGRPYYLDRYKNMRQAVTRLGLNQPKVIITEFGTDDLHHPSVETIGKLKTGGWMSYRDIDFWKRYRQQPDPGVALAHEIADAVETIYDQDPHVLGVCYFAWGGYGQWETYDLSKSQTAIEQLIKESKMGPSPCQLASEAEINAYTPSTPFKVLVNLKVRTHPVVDVCSETPTRLDPGDVITTCQFVDYGGYRWRGFKIDGGHRVFYAAERSLDNANAYLQPVPDAEPQTIYRLESTDPLMGELFDALATVFDNVVTIEVQYAGD